MINVNQIHKLLVAAPVVAVEEEVEMTNEQAMAMIAKLTARLEEKKVEVNSKMKKNHRPGKAANGRKYVLLSKELAQWGKVPQQQADIASLLSRYMTVGEEYTEQDVFNILIDGSGEYSSLCTSKQDPTYLFRYYRGLKNDHKHAGLVARNFIRQIG